MFKDYYKILEISFEATPEEIKSAYKRLALKWHPDRNHSGEALQKMQDINEAYLILKDTEAKRRYDEEHTKFRKYKQSFSSSSIKEERHEKQRDKKPEDYVPQDEILQKWMRNAREQAQELVSQTISAFQIGAKAAGKEIMEQTTTFLILGMIFMLLFALSRSCN
jgi:curved DNA-binding protein CbpA